MDADDPVGVDAAQLAGDSRAPVAALGAEPLVAEACHQLDPRVRDATRLPAGLVGRAGEPESGNARQDHVEGVGGITPVRRRVRQRTDDVQEFHDRTRPAVRDDQRGGAGLGRADVCEVHMRAVDLGRELRPLVQPRLRRPPVVLVPPVPHQLAQVLRRHAVGPSDPGQLVGPPGAVQTVVQVVQVALRNVDTEGMDAVGGGRRRHDGDASSERCNGHVDYPAVRPMSSGARIGRYR